MNALFSETSKSYEFLRDRGGVFSSSRLHNIHHHNKDSDDGDVSAGTNKVHISFLAGIRIIEPGRDPEKYSGYQVMRLATELVPTYAAILGKIMLFIFW